jgi:hypothetical protein
MRGLALCVALGTALAIAGCFSPHYKEGLICSDRNTCPPGFGCNPQHICERNFVPDSGVAPKDGGGDAPSDAKFTDASSGDDAPGEDSNSNDAAVDLPAVDAIEAPGADALDGGATDAAEAGAEAGVEAGVDAGSDAPASSTIPGLIGHWALGDEHMNGRSVPDLATADGAQNGTIYDNGGYLQTVDDRNGNPNKALFFSADDYVSDTYTYIHMPGMTSLPSPVTLTAWIAQQPGNQLGVVAGINRGPQLFQDEYHITLRVPTAASQYGSVKGPTLIDGKWLFVAGVVSPSGPSSWNLDLYVDGALYASTTVANAGVQPSGEFMIGGLYGCSGPGCNDGFKGDIDDVRVYNRALTGAEVMTLYKTPTN